MKIKLGDKVKDPITGYAGVAYCCINYLQGCDRIGIQMPVILKKDELPVVPELFYVDEPQLVVVKSAKPKKKATKDIGGPSHFGSSHKR